MSIELSLKRLGLSAPEARVYVFLVQHGQSSAPQIQSALGMDKVGVYRALAELEKKDYVERLGETRNQQFVARPAEKLLERYDQQMQQLSSARSDVEQFMQDILDNRHDLYKNHNIQVYEGVEGYRVWNDERLKGSVDVIREYGRNDFLEQFFRPDETEAYMQAYIQRRVAKNIPIRVLADANSDVPERDRSNAATLKEARAIAMPSDLDGFMSVFGDRIGFYTKQSGEYLGIIIQDKMLAKMMAIFFDALWEHGKGV